MQSADRAAIRRHCSALLEMECTALKMLNEGEENQRRQNAALWLAARNPEALKVVQNSRLGQELAGG